MSGFDYSKVPQCVKDLCSRLVVPENKLKQIICTMRHDIERGLRKSTHEYSVIKCFVTYVQDLPRGTETGKFLALDLGGTNFRVLLIELVNKECKMDSDIYEIPEKIRTGTGKELFDHIAQCLTDFIKKKNLGAIILPLGFTFSFPCRQEGLTVGILEKWTKGFKASGVEGKDVVKFLNESLHRLDDKIYIDVMAILNDTTGTMMSCAWKDHQTYIGLIVGTGTNACYYESVENAELFDGEKNPDKPYVIINTEWGAFGDDGTLDEFRTEYDNMVDKNSINPGRQTFEKMISGMYLGELVRLMLLDLIRRNLFLKKGRGATGKFSETDAFKTKFVSGVERDADESGSMYDHAKKVLNAMEVSDCSIQEQDLQIVRYVCEKFSTRAAHLAASGVIALVEQMGRKQVTVGVDGTVYKMHPHFATKMKETCELLAGTDYNVKLMLSEDGSGRGAALVAAVAADRKGPSTYGTPQCRASTN